MLFIKREPMPEGEPCEHPSCLQHVSHPCEGCGRIAGYALPELPEMWRQYFAHLEYENERLRELCNDVALGHRNPYDSNYNECDKEPCAWCEEFEALGGE